MEQEPIADFAESGEHSLEAALRKSGGRGKRMAQAGGGVAALGLVVAVLLAVFHGPLLLGQTATATELPPHFAHIVTNVNYGTLTVNGKAQAVTGPDILITLTRDDNVVKLEAPPFQAMVCAVGYDPQPAGGVSGQSNHCNAVGHEAQGGLRLIDMSFTEADLASLDRGMLLKTLYGSFTGLDGAGLTPLAVGDHYATGFDGSGKPVVAVAQEPLMAQLQTKIVDVCGGGCGLAAEGMNYAEPHVRLDVTTQFGWYVADRTGRVVAAVDEPMVSSMTVDLAISPQGNWGTPEVNGAPLANEVAQELCDQGEQVVGQEIVSGGGAFGAALLGAPSLAGGCLFQATTPYHGVFVARFGAVMAGDQAGHLLAPHLPVATADEVAAAKG